MVKRHYEWKLCDEYMAMRRFIMSSLIWYVASKYHTSGVFKSEASYSITPHNPDKIRRFNDVL